MGNSLLNSAFQRTNNNDRFPIDPYRLSVSHQALQKLYERDGDRPDRAIYPWRCVLNQFSSLPALFPTWLPQPLSDDEKVGFDLAGALLKDPSHAQALFGEPADDIFEKRLVRDQLIRVGSPNDKTNPGIMHHFIWRQIHQGYPVLGCGVRVHGVVGNTSVAVSNSYLPINEERVFVPVISEEQAKQRGWLQFLKLLSQKQIADLISPRLRRILLVQQSDAGTDDPLAYAPGQEALVVLVEKLYQASQQQDLSMLDQDEIREAMSDVLTIDLAQFGDQRMGIVAFEGDYRLIARVCITLSNSQVWCIDVDVERDIAPGNPWPAFLNAPHYYTKSSELEKDQPPTGQSSTVDIAELLKYVELIDNIAPVTFDVATLLEDPAIGLETTTVAANTQFLYRYLKNELGQDPPHTVKVRIEVGKSGATTGFSFATTPPMINFERDISNGILQDTKVVYDPARDPEVVLHELTHAFLWALNGSAWVTLNSLEAYARALQEGYAMYFARSVGAGNDVKELDKSWARGAYRQNKKDETPNWGNQWQFKRAGNQPGADSLLAPNTLQIEQNWLAATQASLITYNEQIYNEGMVWARALWDLRDSVGVETTSDLFALNAYLYLYGYIVNFDLAAEAVLNVAAQLQHFNLVDGMQSLWAGRRLTAGQAINGFAGNLDKTLLLVATDQGLLKSTDQGKSWMHMDVDPPAAIINAVALDGDIIYIAAIVSPPSTAGNGAHWDPEIYVFEQDQPGAVWQKIVPNWQDSAPNKAIPTSLLVPKPGNLIVGSNRGGYLWDKGGAAWTVPNQRFSILGLSEVNNAGNQLIEAYTPNQLARYRLNQGCEPALPSADDNFTCITSHQSKLYAGTQTNGLFEVSIAWDKTLFANFPTTRPVLAVATDGVKLYVATADDVRVSGNLMTNTMFISLGAPCSNATVTSLLVLAGDILLAGTVAHGIWRHDTNGWGNQPVYSPPTSSLFKVAANAQALVAVEVPQTPQDYTVDVPGANVHVSKVIQPGFPQQTIPQNADGTYTLAAPTAVVLLNNLTNGQIALQANVALARAVGPGQIQFT